MNSTNRVVITGIGLVTPLGQGTDATWSGLIEGKSGIGPITHFDPETHPVRIAGEVPSFDPSQDITPKELKRMDLFIQYGLVAALAAVRDAGLEIPVQNPERVGVLVGVGLGGLKTIEEALEVLRTKGAKRLSPFMIPKLISNLAPGYISIALGTRGPNFSPSSACATGGHAIGEAFEMIKGGRCDVVVAGGAEATITPLGVSGFAAMRALSNRNDDPARASRPFDRDRNGFVCAEGSGVVIMESLESARKRGARIYAEVCGYGQSSDSHHITLPHPEGAGANLAMMNALSSAGLSPDQVQYINAHGTSTPAGDIAESKAIENVFGQRSDLWVSSTKSMMGHMLGAAGAVEAAISALALHRGIVPATINLDNVDPQCRLDYVPNQARERTLNYALSNSFGFGGTNVSLILGKV
jgi:3-oxoacyl-[acyl-carrier-protein] synthase II